jgi:hypothetical protein
MVVSVVVPDEIGEKLDTMIIRSKPPKWPFPTTTVVSSEFTASERKAFDRYNRDFAAYELAQRDRTRPRNRSEVLRKIILEYFSPPNTKPLVTAVKNSQESAVPI